MRLWVLSDLQIPAHSQELWIDPERIPEADLAIVSGDFCPPLEASLARLVDVARRMPVVYVPGNRDFYRMMGLPDQEMDATLQQGRILADKLGIKLLYNEEAVFGDVRVLGTTLWTDYALYGDQEKAMEAAGAALNDHRLIRTDRNRFTPQDALRQHEQAVSFLTDALSRSFDGTTVAATHHAPHPMSIDPKYEGNAATPAFASDLSRIMQSGNAPDLWVHGGLHHCVDYEIGNTRVVSNSKGYPYEKTNFQMDLTIEVGERKPALAV